MNFCARHQLQFVSSRITRFSTTRRKPEIYFEAMMQYRSFCRRSWCAGTTQMEDYKYLFKIVLVGNAGVGKTCLVRKFTQGIFPPGQSATIGVDFMIKTVKVGEDKIKAGQERFRSITQSYYRSAHAIVLVYDVACQPSFDCLPEWLSEIEQYANRKVLKILVGNKVDKDEEREVPERIGKSFADANGFDYFLETSALDATNVDTLFQEVATRLTNEMKTSDDRYHGRKNDGSGTPAISLIDRAHQQVNNCCGKN